MNEILYLNDIICARSTPPGSSAIAVIRISGKNSWDVLKKIFLKRKSKSNGFKSHRIYYGSIIDDSKILDNVVILTFEEGKSFTGEESFEINCHGSEVLITMIINLLLKNNVRIAEPGEFSKRAFLNGKIDLTEAESIMDIINASTKKSALIAVKQLSGGIEKKINEIKQKIIDLLSEVEVNIDYPEEDITYDLENWKNHIKQIINLISKFLIGFRRGRFFREGIQAVIMGKTNSGKSTLFNYLLNEDKAIVSDIHGTTRDYLDGIININGYGIRIYDTAGLRLTGDPVEIEGTKRSKELSQTADILIYVISSDKGLAEDDKKNIINIDTNKKILFVINKIDLIENNNTLIDNQYKIVSNFLNENQFKFNIASISALKKTGLDDFNNLFCDLLIEDNNNETEDPVITNTRHAHLLLESQKNLENAYIKLEEELLDLSAFELRDALDKLGEITGEVTPEDVLGNIFSKFCVGK